MRLRFVFYVLTVSTFSSFNHRQCDRNKDFIFVLDISLQIWNMKKIIQFIGRFLFCLFEVGCSGWFSEITPNTVLRDNSWKACRVIGCAGLKLGEPHTRQVINLIYYLSYPSQYKKSPWKIRVKRVFKKGPSGAWEIA